MRRLRLALIGSLVLALSLAPVVAEVIYDIYDHEADQGVCLSQNGNTLVKVLYQDLNGNFLFDGSPTDRLIAVKVQLLPTTDDGGDEEGPPPTVD